MRISFEITADDVVAANLLNYAHSPATRWLRWLIRGIGPLIAIPVVIIALFQDANDAAGGPRRLWIALPLATVVGGGLFLFLPWHIRRSLARSVRKKIAAERLEGTVVGTCTMELTSNRLTTKTRLGESAVDLCVIKSIVEFDDYALVYLTSTQIHIIPWKSVLPDGDYRRFVAALTEAWESRDSQEAIRETNPTRPDDRVPPGPGI